MNGLVERLHLHTSIEQVGKTVFRDVSFAVQDKGKADVKVTIVVKKCLHKLHTEPVVGKNGVVGNKLNVSTIGFISRKNLAFVNLLGSSIGDFLFLAIATGSNEEEARQCIYSFQTNAVQAYRLLED